MGLVETKLLGKTVALAQVLSVKLKLGSRSERSHGNSVVQRYKLLLVAFLKIVRAVGQVERAIGGSDKYLTLLHLLSHFSFQQATQLLSTPKWIPVVVRKLRQVKLKKALGVWLSRLRASRVKQMFSYNSSKPAPSTTAATTINNNMDMGMDILSGLTRSTGPAEDDLVRLKRAIHSWRLAVRSKLVAIQQARIAARNALLLWEKMTMISRLYRFHYGQQLVTAESVYTPDLSSRYGRIRSAFKEWRAAAKLRARRMVTSLPMKRKMAFEYWLRRTEILHGAHKVAQMYHRIRIIRPIMLNWVSTGVRQQFAQCRAHDFHRAHLLERGIDQWIAKVRDRRRGRRFLDSWRACTEYRSRNMIQANYFYNKKLAAAVLHRFIRKKAKNAILQQAALNFSHRQQLHHAANLLGVWYRLLQWIRRNSEKVRTIRAAKDAKACLDAWRSWRGSKQTADALFKATLFKRVLGRWQNRLHLAHDNHSLLAGAFDQWHRLLVTKRTVRIYLQLNTPPSTHLLTMPQRDSTDWVTSLAKHNASVMLRVWKRRALLKKRLEMFLSRKERAVKADYLKGWRLHTNVTYYVAQKPWRTKKRTLRRMLQASRTVSSREHAQGQKLVDYLQGKQYVITFRAFERWQQAFQSHKIEEHLCNQNLTYYQHNHRFQVMKAWRLGALAKVFTRLTGMRSQKRLLVKWHRTSANIEAARKNRLISRHLQQWRHSYRTSVVKGLLRDADRRVLRLSFMTWRQRARSQQQGHNRSTEFIGVSSKRYYLQKWLTESRLHRISRKPPATAIKMQPLQPMMPSQQPPPKPILIKSIGEDQPRYLQQVQPNTKSAVEKTVRFQEPTPFYLSYAV